MKRVFGVALGILTAIGGFLDIGDLVTNAVVGSRFGLSLAWAVVLGVVGICVFAQMSGRVAAVSGRATFELIRERLGPRVAVMNLGASFLINLMTITAEVGGMALAIQLVSSVSYLLWVPFAALAVWLIIWRVKFKIMENVAGLVGLCLIGFAVALFLLSPDWGELGRQALQGVSTETEEASTYWFFAVALFGAALTPYEVFFFSSGAVEEGWTVKDLAESRANVLVGFPLGGVLSLAIAGCMAVVFLPQLIGVTTLSQVMLPVAEAGGKLLLALIILGVVAATSGAALETTLSAGYTAAQFLGWSWGKFRPPAQAARFHLLMIICLLVGIGVLLTGVDPIKVTEISVVFSAVALPLTYLPILIVANDPEYMGEHVNGRVLNGVALVYLVVGGGCRDRRSDQAGNSWGDHGSHLDGTVGPGPHHWTYPRRPTQIRGTAARSVGQHRRGCVVILTDLLGARVFGPEFLGFVSDARFLLESDSVGEAARLYGIIVSPHAPSSSLGYERSGVRSPWPIAALVRWRHPRLFPGQMG
jgi:manganese transport protein